MFEQIATRHDKPQKLNTGRNWRLMQQSPLKTETYDEARILAPGWDIYVLEQEWRNWMDMGGLEAPKSPDKAFLGFAKKWFERRGSP